MKNGNPSTALHRALSDALRALRHEPRDDESVHAVRKHIKHARAALRLLRGSVGESAYRRENRRLRDASRPLAQVRDARVVAQTLSALRRRISARERPALQALWSQLAAGQSRAQRQLDGTPLERIARSLQATARIARRWERKRVTRSAIRSDLQRTYRNARKAAASSQANPTNESLHEARKQAKYLGSMLEILRPRLAGSGKARRGAIALGSLLGDDHDLAMLQEKLAGLPAATRGRALLLERIQKRRRKLQRKAMREAKRLYRRKPGRFARHLELE